MTLAIVFGSTLLAGLLGLVILFSLSLSHLDDPGLRDTAPSTPEYAMFAVLGVLVVTAAGSLLGAFVQRRRVFAVFGWMVVANLLTATAIAAVLPLSFLADLL